MRSSLLNYHFLRAVIVILFLMAFLPPVSAQGLSEDSYGGRSMIVFVPTRLPAAGARALVVVLHGGMGNASRIAYARSEPGLNLDAPAETNGFLVAYLNGTPVTRRFGSEVLGWNAGGGCCGVPAESNVDDVGYIRGAVAYLIGKYGVDRNRVFGMGHSNGAMMTQRLMCETNLYAAAVCVSGPLNLKVSSCPAARGKRILAIHGEQDENVPIAGGRGTKGISNAVYNSEQYSQRVFTDSGARYDVDVVKGADHAVTNIDAALQQTEAQTIANKAVAFFGLAAKRN
jgi:polyhydroxybutyrate depolymerase